LTLLSPELMSGLCLFALASSLTPGPNNAMLLASGANFGLKKSVPHMLGVSVGFLVLVAATGLGLGALFIAYPPLHLVLKVAGALYLLYLAFRIATSDGIGGGRASPKPMTFLQAAAFQWVNPKAWAMGLGAVATYAPPHDYAVNVVLIAGVFGLINLPCIMVWASLGMGLRRFLERPGGLRLFNWGMAALLVASLYPLAFEAWQAFTQPSFAP
jgi:threonine/homoserine/homoserine lactone efflux protein